MLTTILFLVYHSAPVQDRSSQAYQIWNKEHQDEMARSKSMQQLLMDKNFSFNGLEIVIVSEGEKYYSWWGHILLRLTGSGRGNPEDDLAISFLADFNDYPLNKIKASFGGYEVMVKTDTIAQFKKEYILREKRVMTYHPLITSSGQNSLLLSTIRRWIVNPAEPGEYSFFLKNCVGLMNLLLYKAQILKSNGWYGYFPEYVIENYRASGIIK